jgi:tetratricopeptide (TPR) repeat protein
VLAGATYLSIAHIRFQALFAIVAVSVGGALLSEFARPDVAPGASPATGGAPAEKLISPGTVSTRLAALSAAILTLFAGLRIADLVSDRYYVNSGHISLFGTGPSWWYPERAAAFLEREHVPGNVFHDYNLGGYLTWRIGPQYADFVDGRYIPFGKELFDEQRLLMSLGPDSSEWKQAAERWQINTLIFPVARYAGLGSFPLQDFCNSKLWKLVYLDDVSVIFVRNRPENSEFLKRFDLRCESAPFAPLSLAMGNSFRARAERFNYLMNTGSILYALSRDAEASSALQEAEKLFPDNPNLHLVKAQLFGATNRLEEAEREYLRVLRSSPSDAAWYALARLYASEHRYSDAVRCIKEAVTVSQVPYERLRSLGTLYLYMDQPESALAAFGRANQNSPYRGDSSDLGKQFNAQLAEGRARAYRQMNDLSRAVAEQESAVRLGAENPARWIALADLYQALGQPEKSLRARETAKSMQK